MDNLTRRGAAKRAAAGAALLAAGGAASGQEAAPEKKGKKARRFSGTSKTGSFQEALDLAIREAHASLPGADRQVGWTLKEVYGVYGGFAPRNQITVEVELGHPLE